MNTIFGQSEEEKRREEAEERQRHNLNLNAASAQADKPMDRAYIDKMTDHQLSQGTIDILSNLLDQDYLLGNMTEAEVHEFRWLARVLRLKVEAMHPPQESFFQSPLFAEFAEFAEQAHDQGRLRPDEEIPRFDFEIPEIPTVPDLRKTTKILDDDASRAIGVLAESWAQKSQEKFGKRISVGQTLILIAAFGIGSGMAIVGIRYGVSGGGGGGGSTIPIKIALGAL